MDDSGKGNDGVLEGQVTMQQLGPVCGFGLHFENGALTVNPTKLSSLVKNEMSVVTWIKIDSLNQPNIIYACVGGGVVQRLEVNGKHGSPNGYIRWLYALEGETGNVFNIQTEAVITPGENQERAANCSVDQFSFRVIYLPRVYNTHKQLNQCKSTQTNK